MDSDLAVSEYAADSLRRENEALKQRIKWYKLLSHSP